MHNAHLTNDVQLLDVPIVLFSSQGFSVWWIYAVVLCCFKKSFFLQPRQFVALFRFVNDPLVDGGKLMVKSGERKFQN